MQIRNVPADTLVAGDPVRIIQKQSGIKNETNLILFRFFVGKITFYSYLTVAKGVKTE